tara:strand:- start:253 stop:849 length:597 start_codon:yes stop_codon:yes gene_type:complete
MKWFSKKEKKKEEPGLYDQVFPVFKPGDWIGLKSGAIFDTILSDGDERILVKAYGYDLVAEFRFITFKDMENMNAENLRMAAIKNINAYQVDFRQPGQLQGQVFVAADQGFASEKILDAQLMQELAAKLNTDELVVSIPRRGSIMVAPMNLTGDIFQMFVHLHQTAYNENNGMAPITDFLITVKDGKIDGAIELASLF